MSAKSTGKMGLTAKILLAMVAGLVIGLALRLLLPGNAFVEDIFTNGIFNVLGALFVSALRMLVVPLVFVSLVCGTATLSDPSRLGRLGGKTLALYLFTTAVAISLALGAALLVQPGDATMQAANMSYAAKEAPSISDVIIGLVPKNPINAMVEGNMLQIIVFAILFGFSIAHIGERGERLRQFFIDLNEVMMKLVTLVMAIAPIGVFGLIAKLTLTLGMETFGSVVKYFVLVLVVLIVHALVVYPLLVSTLSGLNPMTFLKKMRSVQLFAFSTASSAATLPISIENANYRLGVSNRVSSFTLPLGATVNMDGTAIMQGVATVFIAQVFGIDLSVSDMLMVILTATLASIGTAGVPGVGLIMLAMVLQQVNLPVEGIALILGVDRLLDMVRTAVNVTGDAAVSVVVASSEGELSRETFDDPMAGQSKLDIDAVPHVRQ
ncbi:dicarboxylate/amino acid:cation symporter [Ferrimonas balearica]|uniref:dicarboxylate/amino acid:cation symporter n=1 Tax=Ferrimonas balearica TaxID=44012 RepID=UPI001C99C5C8|nr:dicarboxylate/amino acid:cation symporter [Ferrimonas balearica]MBY5922212.1 dicarboxylate/amino acid:cation symporter [Ferrimonas balearica]MBY5994448.1 dicarboxylate/amino acid:cation symporter [Ferrimonas balearica]